MTISTLTMPNSGERALWWVWLRQRALLALAANLLGRLAVFVRWGPQDDEGESALPNPHSHSSQSLWSRRLPGGEVALVLPYDRCLQRLLLVLLLH